MKEAVNLPVVYYTHVVDLNNCQIVSIQKKRVPRSEHRRHLSERTLALPYHRFLQKILKYSYQVLFFDNIVLYAGELAKNAKNAGFPLFCPFFHLESG